jgi:hypothetical protein
MAGRGSNLSLIPEISSSIFGTCLSDRWGSLSFVNVRIPWVDWSILLRETRYGHNGAVTFCCGAHERPAHLESA